MNTTVNTSLRWLRWAGLATLVGAVLTGCANRSYVTLLDNDDGTTGKVQVTTAWGGVVQLERARQAMRFTDPPGTTYAISQEKLDKDFAGALAAIPRKPVSFSLYFVTAEARLTAESEAVLDAVLKEIVSRDAPDISIIGHTDTVGTDQANEELGLQRALLVVEMIGRLNKIDASKLAVETHGEKNLMVPTPDNTDEPRNRRVEVTIR